FEMKLGISDCIAVLHDPIVILGIFSAFQLEFDLSVLAAVLAVIGYSLNDTVVIYDIVRDNFRKMRNASVVEVVNRS
ncbi:protein translocase subunit SecF, partial [Francisella tularensis subsp. holarctica]|nr:protein translocase subunit SecF [Francisella tularensis subsp. holarctica]